MQECELMDDTVVAFMKDLRDILIKHKVEITASDDWQGYAECGEDIQIHIETDMKNIDMGACITPDTLKQYIQEALFLQ